jgi:hypothetical protein
MNRRDLIDELRLDARLAFRLFGRSPAFYAAAVLTLAVGIGANGALFCILRSALLQPLPYRHPSELAVVSLGGPNQVSSNSGAPRRWQPAVRARRSSPSVGSLRLVMDGGRWAVRDAIHCGATDR